MFDQLSTVEEFQLWLRYRGWVLDETPARTSDGPRWRVTGHRLGRQLAVSGETQEDAWRRACVAARANDAA